MWVACTHRNRVFDGAEDVPCLSTVSATLSPEWAAGHRVVVVTSGAIGVGCLRLGITQRPAAIAQKQALAAVGQVHLMRYYEDFFSAVGLVRTKSGPIFRT